MFALGWESKKLKVQVALNPTFGLSTVLIPKSSSADKHPSTSTCFKYECALNINICLLHFSHGNSTSGS